MQQAKTVTDDPSCQKEKHTKLLLRSDIKDTDPRTSVAVGRGPKRDQWIKRAEVGLRAGSDVNSVTTSPDPLLILRPFDTNSWGCRELGARLHATSLLTLAGAVDEA